jgi:hypothetical protein
MPSRGANPGQYTFARRTRGVEIPGPRKMRVTYEAASGNFCNRYFVLHQGTRDTDESMRDKVRRDFIDRYGEKHCIVSIDFAD